MEFKLNKPIKPFKPFIKLDIQKFAGADEGNQDNQDNLDDPGTHDEGEGKTFTQEDLDKAIQQRLAKERKKAELERKRLEEEMRERIESEKQEALELAKLSEKERTEREFQKEREKFEQERKEFERKKLELDTKEVLSNEELPSEFASFVMGNDAESTLENINRFKEKWQKAIEAEVNKRLATNKPKTGGQADVVKNPFSKEHFNLTEQARLYQEDPELYKQLKAQA